MGNNGTAVREGEWGFQLIGVAASTTDSSVYRKALGDKKTTPATLLAREVIQNSEDASLMSRGHDVPFRMEFDFRRLPTSRSRKAMEAISFDRLSARIQMLGASKVGLPTSAEDLLKQQEEVPKLEFLAMSDFGASGLVGDVELNKRSGWFSCFISFASSEQKVAGSGGSYGFGKSAFVNGSALSTVVAYTKSGPSSEPESRYFGALCYLSGYEVGDTEFAGLSALGDPDRPFSWLYKPFVDDDADALAAIFGFPERSDDPSDWGTTIAVLFPTTTSEDLFQEVEENWWPALEGPDPKMSISVRGWDGEAALVSPKASKALSFLPAMRRSFEIATGGKAEGEHEYSKAIVDDAGRVLGQFAAVADPELAFSPKGRDGKVNVSRVALMRSPRMVVDYLERDKGSVPFVDAVFIASDEQWVEEALKASEPVEHDEWWPAKLKDQRFFEANKPDAARVALAVKAGIESALAEFRDKLKPPKVEGPTYFRGFGRVLGSLLAKPGEGGGGAKAEPITIHFLEGPDAVAAEEGSRHIRYEALIEVGLDKSLSADGAQVQLGMVCRVVEDEDASGDEVGCKVNVESPSGFDWDDGVVELVGSKVAKLRVVTDPVLVQTSVSIKPTAKLLRQKGALR